VSTPARMTGRLVRFIEYMPLDAQHAWDRHMAASVKAGTLDPADEHAMLNYFASTALHLTNRP
jgi:hypothetical protein